MPIRTATAPVEDEQPTAAVAAIGHNEPPVEERIAMEFREALLEDRPDFQTRYDNMLAAKDRVEVEDDDSLGRAGDLIKLYRAAGQHIDQAHTVVKRPYLEAGRAADAEKNRLKEPLGEATRAVNDKMNAFLAKREAEARAERERIAAEQRAAAERAAAAERERARAEEEARRAASEAISEDERRAAEERAAAAAAEAERAMQGAALAPAAAAKTEPVRSDAGATVSGKQEWLSRVDDYDVAYIAVSDDAKVREAVEKAVARRVRAGARTIAGVTIWPVAKANVR